MSVALGQINTQIIDVDYHANPLSQYRDLCANRVNTMLLESAEIDSKDNLKSIMLLQSCVRFECHQHRVIATALNANGQSVIATLASHCAVFITEHNATSIAFNFSPAASNSDEETRLKHSNALTILRSVINGFEQVGTEHPFGLFLSGCFAYDLLAISEDLPNVKDGPNTCPDYVFYLGEALCVIDHQHQHSQLITNQFNTHYTTPENWVELLNQATQTTFTSSEPDLTELPVAVDKSDVQFCNDVLALKEHILAGDIFQVVPSRTFSLPCPYPLQSYAKLKTLNPSPYMFYMQDQDFSLFGASPESALKYDAQTNWIEIYPIAGTRPRGKRDDGSIDYDLDSRIELDLREDLKEKAEHTMLVDLARNDVARVSQPGTRHVKELLKVDRYSHVMHLVSRVIGQLKPELDALHAYQACMNMGTLVGAPKVSAATLIREVEQQRRGSYGGAVGYLDSAGDMDSCIVIRSAFVKHGVAHIQAGAGVVFDSDPQSEADETRAKAQAVIRAVLMSQTPDQQHQGGE